MRIELLYFVGCPNYEALLPKLREMAALEDVEPGAAVRTDFGLKCRLYRSSEGISGMPPERWITAAIGGTPMQRAAMSEYFDGASSAPDQPA